MTSTTNTMRAAARKAISKIKRNLEIFDKGEKMDTLAAVAFAASSVDDEKSVLPKNDSKRHAAKKRKATGATTATAATKKQRNSTKSVWMDIFDYSNKKKSSKSNKSDSGAYDSDSTSTSRNTCYTSSDKNGESSDTDDVDITDDDDDDVLDYYNKEEVDDKKRSHSNQKLPKMTQTQLTRRYEHERRCLERQIQSNRTMYLSRRLARRTIRHPMSPLEANKLDFSRDSKNWTIITKKSSK